MKIKREYTIGALVIAGILLLIFGLNYLKGLDLLARRNVFHVVYKDVSGITSASPVYHNGYKVGQVIGIEMLEDGTNRIAVTFQMNERRLRLTDDTQVQIFSADLLGRGVGQNSGVERIGLVVTIGTQRRKIAP